MLSTHRGTRKSALRDDTPRENAACRDRSFPIARREKRRSSRLHARPHQRTRTISAMLITCALVGTHGTIKRDSFPLAPEKYRTLGTNRL